MVGPASGIYYWVTDLLDDFLEGICGLVVMAIADLIGIGIPMHLTVAFNWRKLERSNNNLAMLYSYQRDLANYEVKLKR